MVLKKLICHFKANKKASNNFQLEAFFMKLNFY